jgi:hypothetical protein
MGRELTQVDETEWWIIETMSGYGCRVSISFTSKEEAIGTLRKGNCDEQVLEVFEKNNGIHSMDFNANGQFKMNGVKIDEALGNADALCPSGEYSLSEDGECAHQGCDEHAWAFYPAFEAELCEKHEN